MAGNRTLMAIKHLKDELEKSKNNNSDLKLNIDDAELIIQYIDDINNIDFESVVDKLNSIKYDLGDIADEMEDIM